MRPLEAIVWDQDEVLSPLLQAGTVSSPTAVSSMALSPALLSLLLQRGWLEALNLNLQWAPIQATGVGGSGRDWGVWLRRRGHFPLTECLTTRPPSRGPISPVVLTPVAVPYWALTLWKGLCIAASLSWSYSLSLEGSGGRPGNLRGKQSSWQEEANLRESHSFYRTSPSYKLEEADPFTQIGPSHAHSDLVDRGVNIEHCVSYRQVAPNQLHTTSDSDMHFNPTQVDPEPTKPEVGFRPNQSSIQLATQAAYPKGASGRCQILLGPTPPWGQPLYSTL